MNNKLLFSLIGMITGIALAAGWQALRTEKEAAPSAQRSAALKERPLPHDPLIAGFQRSTAASAADTADRALEKRGFLNRDMRPQVPGRFVRRARTALVRPAPPAEALPTLAVKHSVELIEDAKAGEAGVIVMKGESNVAAIGGLMAAAVCVAGMILDGGVSDLEEICALALRVFARSVTPAAAAGSYDSVAKDVPVECAGVTIQPGDIIVAGEGGVVAAPAARAAEVLKRPQEFGERESPMVLFIQPFKSLSKAIAEFDRI